MDFFVVGTSRTGSTLLREILHAHPGAAVLNESHWVPTMLGRYGSAPAPTEELLTILLETHWDSGRRVVDVSLDLSGRQREEVLDELRQRVGVTSRVGDFHPAVVDAVFGLDPGSRKRGDKTPDYGFYLAELQGVWPEARFVHMVRDGLAASRSMARHPGCRKMIAAGYDTWVPLSFASRFEDLEDPELPFVEFVRSWRRRMSRIRREARSLRPGTYLEVRYEDLLARPELVLPRVAEFLELSVEPSWLEEGIARVRPGRNQPPLGAEEAARLKADDLAALDLAPPVGPAEVVSCQGDPLVQIDARRVPGRREGVWLFSCVRDELLRLPYFLRYYRDLGVSRFFFVDNGSTDGTRAYLVEQADVHVFSAPGSYAGSFYGVHWINALLERFGSGGWVIVADADELLVYPDQERCGLPELLGRLERAGAEGFLTFLLDMYPSGPLREARYEPGQPFLEAAPFFDADSYDLGSHGSSATLPLRGGVRRRLFWKSGERFWAQPPFLPKIPLVRWSPGLAYRASTHLLDGVRLSEATGVLMHFKLFSDFYERSLHEAERGEHWDEAAQYSVYAETLRARPDLDPTYEGSVRFSDTRQLVEIGLMTPLPMDDESLDRK